MCMLWKRQKWLDMPLAQVYVVIKGKTEDVELPEKADVLISEPMGTLLVNQRMLETYVIACWGPFSVSERKNVSRSRKAFFWQQQNYYGVDLTPLYGSAHQGYFSQPVVDAFDPRLLVAPSMSHVIDFTRMKVWLSGSTVFLAFDELILVSYLWNLYV
ncbi:unnamed protein product [Microthlaspi erraticum]|uniref:Uncharacterized protein n=1 Tax=Microthlaspi erraticum TaxID=1685480 RepID=A0A6D2JKZ9_9BRAS|nr:unnamed protein product [Microthlaspi erraticum]